MMAPPKKTEIASIDDQEHVKAFLNITHGKTPKVEYGVTIVVTFDKLDEVPALVSKAVADVLAQAKKNNINMYPSPDHFR